MLKQKSILDKMFKLNTYSLEVRLTNSKRKKFTIHFIEEDVNHLKTELEHCLKVNQDKQSVVEPVQTKQDKENIS